MRGILDHYALVVEGSLTDRTYDGRDEYMHFHVDVSYNGDSPELIVLDQLWRSYDELRSAYGTGKASLGSDCSYSLYGEIGERYVLFLEEQSNGVYKPGGCVSFAKSDLLIASPYAPGTTRNYELIQSISVGGTVVPVRDDSWPLLPFLIVGIVGAGGILLVVSHLRRSHL